MISIASISIWPVYLRWFKLLCKPRLSHTVHLYKKVYTEFMFRKMIKNKMSVIILSVQSVVMKIQGGHDNDLQFNFPMKSQGTHII